MHKVKSVKIHWKDAIIYSASSAAKKLELGPDKKTTEGTIEEEGGWGVIVKNPYTVNIVTNKRDSREENKRKATFLFIPSGMIEKIEENL